MSPQEYNLLYAIYAWTNAVVVIAAGFFIDKLGNRIGVFLFSFLCLIGSATFAAGTFLRGTSAMLPIMLLGRLLFGSGNGSLSIVQNRITAFWFRDKELAMAFGFTLAFSRLGSVLNFLLTAHFDERFGLAWTLWGGALLCAIGFVSAIMVGVLDKMGIQQLGQDGSLQQDSKKLKFTDIKHFNALFWLLALTIMFFYDGIFPFVADASNFIQEKYGFKPIDSSYMAGSVYYLSMVLSPFLGFLIDVIGKRGILALLCGILTIPVFALLSFTFIHPLFSTILLGITYSFAAASMWPSIPLVVHQSTVGTAMGLTTSLQMIGIGVSNVCVGAILGKDSAEQLDRSEKLLRWKYVMIFLLGNTLLCIVLAMVLNIVDHRRDGVLNESRRQKMARLQCLLLSSEAPETGSAVIEPSYDDDDASVIREDDLLLPGYQRPQSAINC
jgi:MFS family permease